MNPLSLAGMLSFLASAIHVGIIFGGPRWYRFFGAGEHMAQLAEARSSKPALITASIATLLCVWGLYAWSGAGIIPGLPFTKYILVSITSVYLLRGVIGCVAPFLSTHPAITANSKTFWLLSSVVCLFIGVVHFYGVAVNWSTL